MTNNKKGEENEELGKVVALEKELLNVTNTRNSVANENAHLVRELSLVKDDLENLKKEKALILQVKSGEAKTMQDLIELKDKAMEKVKSLETELQKQKQESDISKSTLNKEKSRFEIAEMKFKTDASEINQKLNQATAKAKKAEKFMADKIEELEKESNSLREQLERAKEVLKSKDEELQNADKDKSALIKDIKLLKEANEQLELASKKLEEKDAENCNLSSRISLLEKELADSRKLFNEYKPSTIGGSRDDLKNASKIEFVETITNLTKDLEMLNEGIRHVEASPNDRIIGGLR